jgi:chaperonin GroEL
VYSQQVQLQVAAVKTPGFGDNLKSDELDIKLERATVDLLSSTGSITITKEDTIVLNGEGAKDAIQTRCEQIQALIADPTTSNCNHTKLQEHVAKLSGGVTVIKVGGSSEVEVGEKKDPYDDVGATMTRLRQALNGSGHSRKSKVAQSFLKLQRT